jgi:hypothetical protein
MVAVEIAIIDGPLHVLGGFLEVSGEKLRWARIRRATSAPCPLGSRAATEGHRRGDVEPVPNFAAAERTPRLSVEDREPIHRVGGFSNDLASPLEASHSSSASRNTENGPQ